jgi:hypothetical protein
MSSLVDEIPFLTLLPFLSLLPSSNKENGTTDPNKGKERERKMHAEPSWVAVRMSITAFFQGNYAGAVGMAISVHGAIVLLEYLSCVGNLYLVCSRSTDLIGLFTKGGICELTGHSIEQHPP